MNTNAEYIHLLHVACAFFFNRSIKIELHETFWMCLNVRMLFPCLNTRIQTVRCIHQEFTRSTATFTSIPKVSCNFALFSALFFALSHFCERQVVFSNFPVFLFGKRKEPLLIVCERVTSTRLLLVNKF